jgi:hypothetical protein
MLRKIDLLLARRLWIVGALIVVLMIFGDWLFDGERPFCGWEGVFGHISWCPKPTAWEEQIARERAMEEERDDPIEQAIIRVIRWCCSPDYQP